MVVVAAVVVVVTAAAEEKEAESERERPFVLPWGSVAYSNARHALHFGSAPSARRERRSHAWSLVEDMG